jgi:glycerol kinase
MPRYVLALDQGTSSSRAVLYDEEGVAVATAQYRHAESFRRKDEASRCNDHRTVPVVDEVAT